MIRNSVNLTLSRLYWLLFLLLALLLAAKFADDVPGLPPAIVNAAGKFYEFTGPLYDLGLKGAAADDMGLSMPVLCLMLLGFCGVFAGVAFVRVWSRRE